MVHTRDIATNVCKRLIEAGIIFLIVFTPIYYGSVTLGTTTVIKLTILFMLLIWGVEIALSGAFAFRRTPLDIVILLFCMYSVISTLFFSRYAYVSYMGLSSVLCISALYFIVVNHIRSKSQLIRLFVVILVVGFAHAFAHLMGNAVGLYSKSSTGVMLNVGNHFAGYMVIIIPLTVAMSFVVEDIGKRILLIFASIVMAAAMAFSLIAGAMLAFLLSLMLVTLLLARSSNAHKQALIMISVVLCSLLIVLWFGHKPVLKELLTLTNLEAGSPAGRLSLWRSSLAMFIDHPVIGTGLGTFDYIYPAYRLPDMYGRAVYAHSDWLQVLTEMGGLGFAIVLTGSAIFFVWLSRRLPVRKLDNSWTKGMLVGGISSVGAGLAHALVDFNFHIPAIAVLFTVIIALTVVVSLNAQAGINGSDVRHPKQWELHLPLPLRLLGILCLPIVIVFFSILLIRPWIADSHYQKGLVLERELQWDMAAGEYQKAIDFAGGNSNYFHALGSVYARRVKITWKADLHNRWLKLALDACHRAIELCPTSGDNHLLLADLHETVENTVESEAAYMKAISTDPNNAFYREVYGNFCLRQGHIQKGIREYRKALDIHPNYLYNVLNDCYTILGADAEKSLLDIAREVTPQDVRSYMILAQFFENQDWHGAALSAYRRAVDFAPDGVDLWRRLSGLLIRQDKLDEAVELWGEYLKLHPDESEAHRLLAEVYEKQGRLDEAISEYLVAADLIKSGTGYLMKAAHLYARQGKDAEALEIWEAVIEKSPHEAEAYYRLGRYSESQGNWADALSFFQQAISAEPRNLNYRLHLAQGYYRRELFYEAIEEWKRALKLQPESVSIHIQLARAYMKIGSQNLAKEHYRQALRLQPDNAEAQKAL